MRDQLRAFIEQNLVDNGAPVADEDELLIDGIVDSIGVTRLISFIDSEFAVKVPPRDVTIDNFRTIAVIAAYVEAQQSQG